MTKSMRAVRLANWQSRPDVVSVPIPTPSAGEVLIKVAAAGICHSDLHVMEAAPGALPYELPFTLGHEVAGWVVEHGPGVTAYRVGDGVAVHGIWACGQCVRCLAGRENYCARRVGPVGGGLGRDGGLADYLLVPAERFLVPLEGLDPTIAAPLTDAGLTSYHAISRSLDRVGVGGVAVVIGIGGLGHLAVQILRAISAATIIAVDQRAGALDLAVRCRAHEVSTGGADAREVVRRASDDRGADLVLDFVGAASTLQLAAELVAVDGDLTIVGSAGGSLLTGKTTGLPVGCRVSAPFWGTRAELADVLSLARRGLIQPEIERFPLGDVLAVYDKLAAGGIVGRAVMCPDGNV
jgi:propanol-preferring alcohol dehydrogenase